MGCRAPRSTSLMINIRGMWNAQVAESNEISLLGFHTCAFMLLHTTEVVNITGLSSAVQITADEGVWGIFSRFI